MKISLPIKVVTAVAIIAGSLTLSKLVEASSDKYTCQEVDGTYGIYSRTPRGKINFLNFSYNLAEDWTTNKRCEEVAVRFQRYYDNGILMFIGTGEVNNLPVLCAVTETGEACNAENMLVTLPPKTDPTTAARQLMDTRGLARGRVIEVNGKVGKLESYVNGNTYYDLEVLEQTILSEENSDRLIED